MKRAAVVAILMIVVAGAVSCGSTPAGPREVAQSMLEAAKAGQYDKMKSYLSPEMKSEFNEAMFEGIEIVSFSIDDELDYDNDSTEVEIDYTITIKELESGEADTDNNEIEMELNSDGEWIIVDL